MWYNKWNLNKIVFNKKIQNMDLQKIIKYFKNTYKRKKQNRKGILTLSKFKKTSCIKKRKSIKIKNINLEKLKIFWNNKAKYYLLILLLLITTFFYIIFWPVFKIKNIEIIKQDNITNMIIAYKAVENYRSSSIFWAEKIEILKRLQNYQQNIREIKINIILPNTIKIIIDSYKGVFNTTVNEKAFILTENWTLIPSQYSEELMELIIINKFDKNKFLDYKKFLDTEYIKKIYKIIWDLKENILSIKIKKITYYVIEREIHIETEKNTTIIFDLNWNSQEQIEKIAIFNKEHKNIERNSIIYIDLRIANKVFYCTTENEYQCINNLKSIYSVE